MVNFWWVISVVEHTSGYDGSPDGENYPVEKKRVYKSFGPNDLNTYKSLEEQISADHTYGLRKLDFIWCLAEDGTEEVGLEELREFLKKEIKLI